MSEGDIQTPERLAERGGLDPWEMLAVVKGKRWRELWPGLGLLPMKNAPEVVAELRALVAAWEAQNQ